jgi:hypothetical protein
MPATLRHDGAGPTSWPCQAQPSVAVERPSPPRAKVPDSESYLQCVDGCPFQRRHRLSGSERNSTSSPQSRPLDGSYEPTFVRHLKGIAVKWGLGLLNCFVVSVTCNDSSRSGVAGAVYRAHDVFGHHTPPLLTRRPETLPGSHDRGMSSREPGRGSSRTTDQW